MRCSSYSIKFIILYLIYYNFIFLLKFSVIARHETISSLVMNLLQFVKQIASSSFLLFTMTSIESLVEECDATMIHHKTNAGNQKIPVVKRRNRSYIVNVCSAQKTTTSCSTAAYALSTSCFLTNSGSISTPKPGPVGTFTAPFTLFNGDVLHSYTTSVLKPLNS